MKITTQTTKKLISCLVILVLASSFMLMKGCGSSQEAPYGYTIKGLQTDLGAPVIGSVNNYCGGNRPIFVVLDTAGKPVNGINVDVTAGATDAFVASHPVGGPIDCSNVGNASSITAQSDEYGRISIDLVIDLTAAPAASAGTTYYVGVLSGAGTGATLVTKASTT